MTAGGWLIYGSGCRWAEATFPQAILFMSQAEQLVYWKIKYDPYGKEFQRIFSKCLFCVFLNL